MNTQITQGTIVVDTQFNECFAYDERNCRMIKDRLRIATEDEKKKLQESKEECISL